MQVRNKCMFIGFIVWSTRRNPGILKRDDEKVRREFHFFFLKGKIKQKTWRIKGRGKRTN